ncbi:MAG: hypothetical protein Q8P78_03335 [bacterium]|nr:hypothetical protein [bacterium]
MKIRYVLLISALVLFGGVPFLRAQETGEEAPIEPVQDYFAFLAEVHVPEAGARDVIALGGVIDINNPVSQDVLAAGGDIIIQSQVLGDVRLAGNTVTINSDIGGNVAVFAKRVEISENATIGGSAHIRAQEVVMNGAIIGDAHIVSQTLANTGSIGGELSHELASRPNTARSPLEWFFRVASLFGMLVVGLVLVSVFPKSMRHGAHASITHPGKDMLWGLLALFAAPIAAFVLMLTIIGVPLGLLLGAGYIVSLYLAQILAGLVIGTYVLGAIRGREHAQKSSLLLIMVIGVSVLWLITGIPAIGGIIKLVAIIWGLGMMVTLKFWAMRTLES